MEIVDPDYLISVVPRTLGLISTQIAVVYLFPNTTKQAVGESVVTKNRLIMAVLTTSLVIGLLSIMVLISIALCFQPPSGVPKSPTSITGIATLVAQSLGMHQRVRNTGHSEPSTQHVIMAAENTNRQQRLPTTK